MDGAGVLWEVAAADVVAGEVVVGLEGEEGGVVCRKVANFEKCERHRRWSMI